MDPVNPWEAPDSPFDDLSVSAPILFGRRLLLVVGIGCLLMALSIDAATVMPPRPIWLIILEILLWIAGIAFLWMAWRRRMW